MFGPASIVVKASSVETLLQVAQHLEVQPTASLHLDQGNQDSGRALLQVLERKCGRLLVNGFPTGVEVSQAMVHGGPFPATSNAMYNSVRASAID